MDEPLMDSPPEKMPGNEFSGSARMNPDNLVDPSDESMVSTDMTGPWATYMDAEAGLRALLESPALAVGYFSAKGESLHLNQAAAEMLCDPDSQTQVPVLPEILAGKIRDRIKGAGRSKEASTYEDEVPVGSRKKVIWSQMQKISGETKANRYFQVLFRDVTALRDEQESARKEGSLDKSLAMIAREALRSEPDLDQLSQIVARITRENVQCGFGHVAILDPENGRLVKHYASFAASMDHVKDPRGGFSEFDAWVTSLYQKSSLDTKASFTSNPSPRKKDSSEPGARFNPHQVMIVPAIAENLMLGRIITGEKTENFTDHDLENIQRIADLFAFALLRNRKEKELLQAKISAEESDRLKMAFLTNISHEIRTPMNGILGFSELLMTSQNKPDKIQKYNLVIQQSGKQLLRIIDDILDISKIATNQIQFVPMEVHLNDMIRGLYEQFQAEINRLGKPLRLVFKLGLEDDGCTIPADPSRLRQVLHNLLHNALKFTSTGLVQFGYYLSKNHQLEFFVEDTGIGIDPSNAEIIFEPFRQLDDTISRQLGGTGLGLAISKGIIEAMDGRIWFENNAHDRGTTFYFSLPINRDQEITVSEPLNVIPKYNWKGRKILIVEDDDLNYEFLAEVILPAGAELHHERQGRPAIQWILNNPETDLILLDIRLPDTLGYDVAKAIKQLNSRIFIIAQTAYAMPGDREKAIRSGCNEYLPKPVNRNRLLPLMDQYLSNKS